MRKPPVKKPAASLDADDAAAGFRSPLTVSHAALLRDGADDHFRETLYLMVQAFGRLEDCRSAFGRAIGLTGSQFTVLIGTAYRQGVDGVSIRALAEHVHLAPTHVTTEVGRLTRKGLLSKRANARDRRGVLVRLSRKGEQALETVAPMVWWINDVLFEGVDRDEIAALRAFLDRFDVNSARALEALREERR